MGIPSKSPRSEVNSFVVAAVGYVPILATEDEPEFLKYYISR